MKRRIVENLNKKSKIEKKIALNKEANIDLNKELEKYLSQVDRYLKYMPISEKTDILSELKSSFYERIKMGQSEEMVIAEIESPKTLAMSYIGDSIVKNKRFSFKRFMSIFGFYSAASIAWVSIIPTLAILTVSFFFSSGVSIIAGIMGALKGIVHISAIENLKFVFFAYELKGVPALIAGFAMAIVFALLGILCWKATVYIIHILNSQKWKLKHN